MKLHEITQSGFLTGQKEIIKFMTDRGFAKHSMSFTEDGRLNVDWMVEVFDLPDVVKDGKLIIKFGNVRYFDCSNIGLTSLEGCPTEVDNDFNCSHNKHLTSLEFAPRKARNFACYKTGILSLIDIADMFDEIASFNFSPCMILEGGLGLLQIPGLKRLYDAGGEILWQPFQIIEKFLGTDNIIECQSELIEAGFEEHAVL